MNNFPSVLETIKDLSIEQIKGLFNLANKIQSEQLNDHRKAFSGRIPPTLATLFFEPSTRTKCSFQIAMLNLGGQILDLGSSTSSLQKGEDFEETLLTLRAQGVDLVIIRSPEANILSHFKSAPPIRLINGGDGPCHHPTQALIDLFTLWQEWGSFDNFSQKTISILGDSLHSRVSNSLFEICRLLNLKVLLYGPTELLAPESDLIQHAQSLEQALSADALYALRIQKERHKNIPIAWDSYAKNYGLNLTRLKPFGPKIVLHPGPVNIGVELEREVMRSPYYWGYRQVENSIPVRMAIIQSILLNKDKSVGTPLSIYRQFTRNNKDLS